MAHFTLRPLDASDGPALDTLMRSAAPMTEIGLTTHYRHDIYASLLAQRPTLFGVVATMPGVDGLVGMATAFTSEVNVGGHRPERDAREPEGAPRRATTGPGVPAGWRRRGASPDGDEGIVMTTVDNATNTASLATASHWPPRSSVRSRS
jgi:hypothetical protein